MIFISQSNYFDNQAGHVVDGIAVVVRKRLGKNGVCKLLRVGRFDGEQKVLHVGVRAECVTDAVRADDDHVLFLKDNFFRLRFDVLKHSDWQALAFNNFALVCAAHI